jgi:sigma-B regulation protein RsbU (phosphoserine phosphatase)
MAGRLEGPFRDRLAERRRRLQQFARGGGPQYLSDLLAEVDAALARLESGTFGVCEVCQGTVETDRLLADPLSRVCLDDLRPEQLRALEHDLEMAGRVQSSLLPGRDVSFEGWQIHCRYQPLGPVSGDYYDLIRPAGGEALLLFGDVAGKGVAASLLMSQLHAIFRSLAGSGQPLDTLVAQANRIFGGSTSAGAYATLVCGRLASGGAVELVNAGHWPALLMRDGGVHGLPATGLPVGLFGVGEYASRLLELDTGDVLLLYTDGLTEARGPSGVEFGTDRVATVLERSRGVPAADVVEALLSELDGFRQGVPHADDLTVMAVRRAG